MPLVGPGVLGTDNLPPGVRRKNARRTGGSRIAPGHLCAMIAAMGIDDYWRTRTIAEAEDQGYAHLRATCLGCGRISDLPWPFLVRRPGISRDTFLGNLPLRCQRRGNAAPIIGVKQQHGTG